MISKILNRISLVSIFLVITLLPLFFLPFTRVPVEISKSLLLIVGLVVAIVFWVMARLFDGKIKIPKSWLLLSGLGVVLAFLLSAAFSPTIRTSFFGIMLDTGTFWFMLSCFILMFMSAVVVRNTKQAQVLFLGVITSSIIVLVFQVLHIMMPETLSFQVLAQKTDNVIGSWGALGIFAGLSSVLSLFALEFFRISKRMKIVLGVFLALSLVFVMIVNLYFTWMLLGVFSLVIFVFKILSYSRERQIEGGTAPFPVSSLVVVVVSLLFLMSGQFIGNLLPNRLGTANIELRPSLSATITVAKETLKASPIFGSGPNRFSAMWAMYKPASINNSQFWSTDFDFGWGLLPTFVVTTGIVGVLTWLAFLYLFFTSGAKAVFATVKDGINMEMSAFFLASCFLLVAALFYPIGSVLLLLAFAFAGVFVGLSTSAGINSMLSLSFLDDHRKSFFSIIFLVFLMIVSVVASFKFSERFASVVYFGRTLTAVTTSEAEAAISRAVALNTNDLYLRTYAQVYLLKLSSQVAEEPSSEEAKAELQKTFDQAVTAATLATTYNHLNYLNFRALGIVYDSVASLGVAGGYDKAIEAYKTASNLNPLNPGLKLSIARAYMANGSTKNAKDYAGQAFALKPDYLENLILLSQIAKSEGDNAKALSYGEQALSIAPQNKELIDYVNSLR